jgi:hypothetical protein
MEKWVSHPDEVDRLVNHWAEAHPRSLTAESRQQYAGRPVWALTVTDREATAHKPAAMFFKPHAHEPAPIAAQMNIISQLLTGEELDGTPTTLPREDILASVELCFMPDANPEGTASAPVEVWEGAQYTNEEFWAWMRGIDPDTGKMWKRVDLWDDTLEDPLPLRYGIAYEQISEHEYVEPNRSHRSSLFRWIFELRERRKWDRILSLHQTEMCGNTNTGFVIFPCLFDDQPPEIQEQERRWAERIVAAWDRIEGGNPIRETKPLGYTGEQRQYFVDRWGDIYADTVIVTTEIRNNSLICGAECQQAHNEAAIVATIEDLMG